ncbi:MAG: ATP-binding protein [Thalassobaculum sp.]|uniref:sensor histidine kinase n=1 Tax=Thalassobaculum sp. TaxID=2022740 RepID=UPI0032EACA91
MDLASRVQSLPFGPVMAATIRRACLALPLVVEAEADLSSETPVEPPASGDWTYVYEIGPGSERLGVLRLRVTDVAAFAPVERMLRDAVGLLGLSIAHRRAREWLETKVIERGEELAERRAAIERHIAENARLAEIVRHSVNPTYVMDLDYRLVWMNEPFLETFGVKWDEAIGRRPSSILYGDDGAVQLVAEVRRGLSETGYYYGEVHNRDRAGRQRVFTLRMNRFRSADGRHEGYVAIREDVTEQRSARDTVDRLIRALDAIEDLVALFDSDERLVFANRLFKDLHPGLDDVLVPGTTMAAILQAFGERGIIEDPERAVPERLEQFRNPAGYVDIQRFGRWFRAKDQKLVGGGTLLIATDITQTKSAELDLRDAVDAAEEANAAKSAFLARMSHELRTPLNAILGLSETLILLEARLSPTKRREYLGDVLQAGRILLSHIDDILNFTRLDAGGFAVHPRPIDPRRAVAEAVRLMRAVARSHSIRLEADLARDLPPALADPRSVRQILVNLLSNAVKFSPAGGVVRLSVVREDDRLRLAVSDHGIGIAPDQIDKIFEPFHQVGDPSHAHREGGTGLGLSIVKALVERNQGTVEVDSRPGAGTTISVSLPMAAPDDPAAGIA